METGNPSSQKQNQYTIVKLARIILIVIISIAAYLFSDLNLGLVSFAFLIFAIFWFILYEFEILHIFSKYYNIYRKLLNHLNYLDWF